MRNAPPPGPPAAAPARAARWRGALPWLAFVAFLGMPAFAARESWVLAYFAQTATMIVFALSYNLLLGETGLLSFGHAAYAGLAAFVAAHVFNRYGIALPLVPLVGGLAGGVFGVVFGYVATRRAGTAFAMITLGIGELAAAAAWTLPDWFGGEAGVSIDRASGPAFGVWSFGPARGAYALIAVWCVLATIAMFTLSRTPLVRLANAVRDNPVRVAALGSDPRRIRHAMVVLSACFAGVAGALGLIDLELASAEGVGLARSGAVLIATVIGGSGVFFGPVLGAVALTFFSVVLASVTRAWQGYLGLLFVCVVLAAPDGLAGCAVRLACGRDWRARWRGRLARAAACALWLAALVLAVEALYARQFASDTGGLFRLGTLTLRAQSPGVWGAALALACAGALVGVWARRLSVAVSSSGGRP
jgi:branched-chain amino acid transport system permease protein